MLKACDTHNRPACAPCCDLNEIERARLSKEPRKAGGEGGPGSSTALIPRTRTQTRRPHMYRVLLLNDDYTTQEFVIVVLRKYFNKSLDEATRIMLHVHNHGVGNVAFTPMKSPKQKSRRSWISPGNTSTRCNASWKKK